MHLKQELEARGLLYQFSDEKVFDLYEKGGQALYFGVDPTADSLHLGNFVVFMQAVNYMQRGNKLYLIVGGATGMIGDPGGKDSERSFLSPETLEHNVQSIIKQVQEVLSHLTKLTGKDFSFEVVNNMDFYTEMNYIDFLRKVGKYITVNAMMKKDTVRNRIEEADKSISYTEFSYMLIQGYDFVKLHRDHKVKLQICGSDQWGNAVTGIELIRKLDGAEAYVASGPLLLDSQGKKFGKSEGNAIWLDRSKSSPYSVYQYFMNTGDDDVERFLKTLTLLSFDRIQEIVTEHQQDTSKRYGQAQLGYYVVATIFGEQAAKEAQTISTLLFACKEERLTHMATLQANEIQALSDEVGGFINIDNIDNICEISVKAGLGNSNGEIKKLIKQGCLFVNEQQINKASHTISDEDYINNMLLLRKGKKVFKVVQKP